MNNPSNSALKYKSYLGSVNYDADDNVLFGKIIGIEDDVSFEGTSVSELQHAFEEAVDDYIETCKELGKPAEKTYKGSFNVRIPAAMHKEVAHLAAIKNVSLNDFVRMALDYAIRKAPDISICLFAILPSFLPALVAGFLLEHS